MINYMGINIVNILAISVLSYMVYQNEIIDAKMKRYFLLAIGVTILVTASEIGTVYFEGTGKSMRICYTIFNVIGFSISPIIPVLLSAAFCNRRFSFKNLFTIPLVINFVFTVLSPKFNLIFNISSQNTYERGNYFIVYIISYISSMLVLLKETVKATGRYENKNRFTLYLIFVFIFIGTTIQILMPDVHTTWISVSLAMTIYYAYFCELSEKYDVLTNLFNRRAYEHELQRLEELENGAIIILDVDDFKEINDTYGHQCGDQCLSGIGEIIKDTFGNIGSCYRIGGDEFSVLSESATEDDILHTLSDFLYRIETYRTEDSRMPWVSIGYAFYHKSKITIENVVEEADKQLYNYKKQHKLNSR